MKNIHNNALFSIFDMAAHIVRVPPWPNLNPEWQKTRTHSVLKTNQTHAPSVDEFFELTVVNNLKCNCFYL